MSAFRFGVDDYGLNYNPPEASDGMGGVDWDKVESVEIEGNVYVKVVRCRDCSWFCEGSDVFATSDWCQNFDCETNEDGYCAWSERRADA